MSAVILNFSHCYVLYNLKANELLIYYLDFDYAKILPSVNIIIQTRSEVFCIFKLNLKIINGELVTLPTPVSTADLPVHWLLNCEDCKVMSLQSDPSKRFGLCVSACFVF